MIHACHARGLGNWDQVNCYCERAMNPDFWAEPLNAMSNLAFLFAACVAYADLRAAAPECGRRAIIGLIMLMMGVGAGSFLFHTYATVWSRLADIVPIAVFVTAYIVVALNWFLGTPVWAAAVFSAVTVAITVAMFLFGAALNGSLAYAPALLALVIVGTILHWRKHGATDWVLSAFCIFAVSLSFRTIDGWPEAAPLGCMVRQMGETSVALGTHALWHVLNAVTLYLLLRAAIENPPLARTR
jgi:hypothetical protein